MPRLRPWSDNGHPQSPGTQFVTSSRGVTACPFHTAPAADGEMSDHCGRATLRSSRTRSSLAHTAIRGPTGEAARPREPGPGATLGIPGSGLPGHIRAPSGFSAKWTRTHSAENDVRNWAAISAAKACERRNSPETRDLYRSLPARRSPAPGALTAERRPGGRSGRRHTAPRGTVQTDSALPGSGGFDTPRSLT